MKSPRTHRSSRASKPRSRRSKIRGLYYPVDITPETLFEHLGRVQTAALIERLIDLFDASMPDPDIEDDDPAETEGDNEPSLAGPENHGRGWHREAVAGGLDDREGPDDDLEPDADGEEDDPREPSLGSLEHHPDPRFAPGFDWHASQANWGLSGTDDREDEHDGRESEADDADERHLAGPEWADRQRLKAETKAR
jgi:hypothetical protein